MALEGDVLCSVVGANLRSEAKLPNGYEALWNCGCDPSSPGSRGMAGRECSAVPATTKTTVIMCRPCASGLSGPRGEAGASTFGKVGPQLRRPEHHEGAEAPRLVVNHKRAERLRAANGSSGSLSGAS